MQYHMSWSLWKTSLDTCEKQTSKYHLSITQIALTWWTTWKSWLPLPGFCEPEFKKYLKKMPQNPRKGISSSKKGIFIQKIKNKRMYVNKIWEIFIKTFHFLFKRVNKDLSFAGESFPVILSSELGRRVSRHQMIRLVCPPVKVPETREHRRRKQTQTYFFPRFNLWTQEKRMLYFFSGRSKVLRSNLSLSWQQMEGSRGETHIKTA